MDTNNTKAIIFDFDGTLADTLPLCFHSLQTVFKTFDYKTFSDDQIKEMLGLLSLI
ncbi:HAD family hydrolase [Salinicoccus sesuvii]|uniref:HAD family hydrolase n=1 Tax=Salinicoccus sesuvii TaxID=868281 RepID=A0ABV7N137_9STAP